MWECGLSAISRAELEADAVTRLTGDALKRWARAIASEWFERRWDVRRESLDHLLVQAYLQGAVDALNDEVKYLQEGGPNAKRERAADSASQG